MISPYCLVHSEGRRIFLRPSRPLVEAVHTERVYPVSIPSHSRPAHSCIARCKDHFLTCAETIDSFCLDESNLSRIVDVAEECSKLLHNGGKLLACGNGGSACQAAHLCEELTGRFRHDRRPYGAIACTDAGHLTCVGNDFGYEEVFARWVEAIGRPGDALFMLSTSGDSPNLLRAAIAAEKMGLMTIAMLGKNGGQLAGKCQYEWIVRDQRSERIQEVHQVIIHSLVDLIEQCMEDSGTP